MDRSPPPSTLPSELLILDNKQQISRPKQNSAHKWLKKWVPQETALNNGKCTLLKWIPEDTRKALEERPQPQEVGYVVEPEYELAFLCRAENCGRIFTEAAAMRKHAQSHVQFICNHEGCGKKFPDALKLRRHLPTHIEEQQFTLPFEGCGKLQRLHLLQEVDSTAPSVGREGMNTKIVIPTCGAAKLYRPFSCPYEGCKKVYKHEYKLNLHLKREHAKNPFEGNRRQVQANYGDYQIDEESEDKDAGKTSITHSYGQGKLGQMLKPSRISSLKIKYPTCAVLDNNLKANPRKCMGGRNVLFCNKEFQEDSEKTEDDQEVTEDEGWGDRMDVDTDSDDDEKTEDERS